MSDDITTITLYLVDKRPIEVKVQLRSFAAGEKVICTALPCVLLYERVLHYVFVIYLYLHSHFISPCKEHPKEALWSTA